MVALSAAKKEQKKLYAHISSTLAKITIRVTVLYYSNVNMFCTRKIRPIQLNTVISLVIRGNTLTKNCNLKGVCRPFLYHTLNRFIVQYTFIAYLFRVI